MFLRAEQIEKSPLYPVYAVYGNDPLLTLEATDTIRLKAKNAGFSERKILEVGVGFQWQSLIDAAENTSLFSPKTLIDLRAPGGKMDRDGTPALKNYLAKNHPDVLLLIYLAELDWKDEKSAWFTELTQKAVVIKVDAPPFSQLSGWIAMRLKRQKQSAPKEALDFIAERVEGNLLAAHQEIQKLALLYPARELTFEEVQDAILNVARYSVAHLREALLNGNLAKFAKVAQSLIEEGEANVLILWGIAEELRALFAVRSQMDANVPQALAFKNAGLWGLRQAQIKTAVGKFKRPAIEAALVATQHLDCVIKGAAKSNASFLENLLNIALLLNGARQAENPR